MYERAALILDADDHPLGELSLCLIALGLRPLYATALDELVLLSREYRSQVGAVLLPSRDVPGRLPALRKHVLEPLGLTVSALVPVGERLTGDVAAALREEGLRFCLPTPHQPHELRFVVTRALSHHDPRELRRDPRVPCDLPVSVESEHRTVEGRLADLSLGGAFVVLHHPHPEGAAVKLRFILAGRDTSLAACVRWHTGANAPAWLDPGMGVEFAPPDDAARPLLERFVAEQIDRFRP